MSHIDHLGISTDDYPASLAFYEAALAPLGISTLMKFEIPEGHVAGLGSEHPFLWVGNGGKLGGRVHIALTARTRAEVDAFHAAAMAAGGRDNGGPGLRPNYGPNYYAAFVFDPDGHNIEAVCYAPE